MKEREVKIVELPSELGAGTRGASLGSDAVRLAGIQTKQFLHGKYPVIKAAENNGALNQSTQSGFAKYLDQFLPIAQQHTLLLEQLLRERSFPLVFSGDHSNGASLIAAAKNTAPEKKTGVIWIDAHADLHSPYTTPSGNIHGMPLAASLGLNNEDLSKNNPNGELTHWENWKKLGSSNITPKITPDCLVYVGIRDLEQEEWTSIERLGIRHYLVAEVRQQGAAQVAANILNDLKDCDQLVISFDADCLDASISVGTGTPVMNGIFTEEAALLLKALLADSRCIGLEVTEINPLLDDQNRMATSIHQILVNAGL